MVTDRCPLALMKQDRVQRVATLYSAYKNGIMPRDGGLSKQTKVYQQAMSLCSRFEGEASEFEAEQRERQAEKERRGK